MKSRWRKKGLRGAQTYLADDINTFKTLYRPYLDITPQQKKYETGEK